MKRKIFFPLIVVSLISSFEFLFVRCKSKDPVNTVDPPIENQTPPPPVLGHTILQVYPHDTSFYTQGLTFYKGELYEGTGDPGYAGQS